MTLHILRNRNQSGAGECVGSGAESKVSTKRKKIVRERPTQVLFGIDTGGTFTDLICLTTGGLRILKVPSTRDDPSEAVLGGVRDLLAELPSQRGNNGAAIVVVHGSTVATNTILERKGARTAFVTTAGFRDVVEIGRQNRSELYNLNVDRPLPLVSPSLRLEVPERILPTGKIAQELDEAALERALGGLASGAEAVAIGFLFSYANAKHERIAERIVRKIVPGAAVTRSSEISPEMREYERFSTAILNAYVAPSMSRYLARLRRKLRGARLEIMGSGGGTISARRAQKEPILTVLSGPAAGVLGARQVARDAGYSRVVTFDMGGTSTDVSLIDGDVTFRNESEIGGLPFRTPLIDVHTVGAGGGSIARVDAGTSLRVGPQSAGADPGPAVYGKGDHLTVTDAHVFLGHLAGDSFLGGGMAIEPEKAVPLVDRLARQAKLTSIELAQGVITVINAEMERAIRVVSQERGHDPRGFTLVAFGGASGLHAAALARALLMPRVLVPPYPGMMCAWGMLTAERARWRAKTVQKIAEELPEKKLLGIAAKLESEARKDFSDTPRSSLRSHMELDLRFRGQTHVVTMGFQESLRGGRGTFAVGDYASGFRNHYAERFGAVASLDRLVEVVTVRVAVHSRDAARVPGTGIRRRRRRGKPEPRCVRPMVLEGTRRATRVAIYERDVLRPGDQIEGPAAIAEYSGTTLVPGDHKLEVDAAGNLVLSGHR